MLDKGQELDWFSSDFIVILAITAVVLLPAFVIWELHVPDPLVHFRLLTTPTFAAGIGLVTVMIFVLYGSLVLLPLFMQTLLGWTSLTAGLWTSPRGIGNALCLPLVGYLLGKRWDGRWMLAAGLVVTSTAFFGYGHMTLESGTWDILGYQLTQGVGMAFMFVPLTTLTMAPISKAETGYATSLYSVMRNIGASMGVSFVTTWVARRSQVHQTVLAAHVTPGEPLVQQYLDQARQVFRQGGADWTTATRQAQAELYTVVQQQAALLSFLEVFRLMGLLFLMAVPLVLLMRRVREKGETPIPH
jgi:DHA2 family multidrug resistance protein